MLKYILPHLLFMSPPECPANAPLPAKVLRAMKKGRLLFFMVVRALYVALAEICP